MKKITLIVLLFTFSCYQAISQAANDDCSSAIDLTSNIGVNCSNNIYTYDGTENDENVFADPDCAVNSSIKDRWYKFQMPANGQAVKIVTSSTSSSAYYDPALEIFAVTNSSDACNSLVSIGCDNDGNPDKASSDFFPQITVTESAGTLIYVRFWYESSAEYGDFNMCLFEVDHPLVATNDDCSSAEILPLTNDCSSPVLKTFNQATPSSDPINCQNTSNEGGDVWFEIQVDNDQPYDITIETSEDNGSNVFDTAISIYSGTCGALTEIECDKDSGTDLFSKINLLTQQGVTLYVRVFPEQIGQNETFYICATKTATLGVNDKILNDFAMYPNPAKDIVNLKFNKISNNNIAVNIYDIQGKLIKYVSKTLRNQSVQLDISNLNTGMYFLKVHDGTNESTKKLIVK
ncbi:T9SS type A sorting domain-containing protein [Aestuariivivens insulae]|uniref:T9SS type A sorting domain-containing protein n=1 Tax=Aestuariivivens insulae TaxID=1621988 RepID=UPI001F577348|nr:T9SS type A sorting domain-containing protein [Aestuariivivens insulae]